VPHSHNFCAWYSRLYKSHSPESVSPCFPPSQRPYPFLRLHRSFHPLLWKANTLLQPSRRFLRSTWLALYPERTRLFHFWYIQNNAPDTERESPVHIFADIPSSLRYCRSRSLPVQRPPEW